MHELLTIAIPFPQARIQPVESELEHLNNPACDEVREALDDSGVHFISMCVLNGEGDHDTYLIMEGSSDLIREGSSDGDLVNVLATKLGAYLCRILRAAESAHATQEHLEATLRRHVIPVGHGLFATPGLTFDGTPSMSVERIRSEARLNRAVRDHLETHPLAGTSLQILISVRDKISQDASLKSLLKAEATPILEPLLHRKVPIAKLLIKGLFTFGWPWFLVSFLIATVLGVLAGRTTGILAGLVTGMVVFSAALVAFAILVGWLYRKLRQKEDEDVPDDSPLDPELSAKITRLENQTPQNHLGGATVMKPGLIRNLTLRIVLWYIDNSAPYRSRPGFLGELGTIHFARWVLLPGTNKLLFFSNYGGSWESYLEDFVTKAHAGLTGVWSNTIGFPKTRNLFGGGATDGDRFKRWARRYQWATPFWYSAYPGLTTRRIRLNAAIRQGLASASTEDEASAWLACFGSRPRSSRVIEKQDVQSILFGGMSRLGHGTCILASLPGKDVPRARAWLSQVEPLISFGERCPSENALIASFSASGLLKFGLDPRFMGEFPIAFQEGMAKEHRARLLGDTGDDAPSRWRWGHGKNPADVALLVYATTAPALSRAVGQIKKVCAKYGAEVVHSICLEEMNHRRQTHEAFGFVDGISQPLIRGTRRCGSQSDPIHRVEPGEFILGYRDNRGFLPISPTVSSTSDPGNILPVASAKSSDEELPNFSHIGGNAPRDLGRNGSYLVIRQLQQDVAKFEKYLSAAADQLRGHPAVPDALKYDTGKLQQWLAAKMVGRWKDGTSLTQSPEQPGTGWDDQTADRDKRCQKPTPDNSFRHGADDPMGYGCPFGSHIRRANPRESFDPGSDEQLGITNRHRILRMGRNYMESCDSGDEAAKRGLLFMCLNADIERQFEFVQQTWIMSPLFHGLESESDPILGHGGESGRLTIPTPNGPILLSGIKDFVSVRGGSYLFLPGRKAVWYLMGKRPKIR